MLTFFPPTVSEHELAFDPRYVIRNKTNAHKTVHALVTFFNRCLNVFGVRIFVVFRGEHSLWWVVCGLWFAVCGLV